MAASMKEHRQYTVSFTTASGRYLVRTVLIVEGYSTEADIPKIVDIMFPGATITATEFDSSKLVPSMR